MIYWFLLFIWASTALYYVITYYKRPMGVFQAPFLFAIAALVMDLSQFTSIIFNPYYKNNILFALTVVMISSFIAFAKGWEKALHKKLNSCYDLNIESTKLLMLILFLIGLYASYKNYGTWMNTLNDADRTKFLIYVNLSIFLDLAFFYSISYIMSKKKFPILIISIIIGASFFYMSSIILLARRSVLLKLMLSICMMICIIKPHMQNKVKIIVLLAFIIGNIASSSIADYRSSLSGQSNANINYIENFKMSFMEKNVTVGMDLGNAAQAIEYCRIHNDYNYALTIWNNFIQLYVPRFLVGQSFKSSLMFKFEHEKYAQSLTHGVTTLTGFYDSFSAFSFLGFIIFYILGYLLGRIWVKSKYSKLYLILYLILLPNIPHLASHGINYIIGKLELFWILLMPIFIIYIKRIKIKHTIYKSTI